ncbi:MAG: hypothetical protein ACJ74O_16675 [Frankiaceae bacterium]
MPAAVHDVLAREVRALVARLRGFSVTRFGAAAPPFATRGDAAHHLVSAVAAAAAAAEGVPAHPVPRLGDFALADQLAVVGADLVAALSAGPDPRLAAGALGELVLHRRDIDGFPPGREAVELLARAWDCRPAAGEVLLAATGRCSFYGSERLS